MPTFTLQQLTAIAQQALSRAGANDGMARVDGARARGGRGAGAVVARLWGGFRNMRSTCAMAAPMGRPCPQIARAKGATLLVDAKSGLAFPACALAVSEAVRLAREFGVAFAGVTNSHHFGVAAYHLGPVAASGMVGLAFGNSPAAMPAAGGKRPLFGTNPIAAVFPRRDEAPLSIDLSLSEAARGKVMVAARKGEPIPPGWALDRDGRPTTDAKAALDGSMLPMGGTKGAMLALVVELLACALTGAAFGYEADSFFVDEGNRPRLGQAFLVDRPRRVGGARHRISIAWRRWWR